MPTAIRIEQEGEDFAYAWIETRVSRLGSDATNELRISGIDSTVATVLFQAGQFCIINRTERPLALADEALPPARERVWPHGEALQVNELITLRLLCHENPEPQSMSMGRWHPDPESPLRDNAERKVFRRQAACFVITCAAVYVSAMLAMSGPSRSMPDAHFGRVLAEVARAEMRGDEIAGEVRQALQAAYSLERRLATAEAKHAYLSARDLLRGEEDEASPWGEQALQFVLSRLPLL